MLKVGLVAGEASGDLLGSRLMDSLGKLVDEVEFFGVGGENMLRHGMNSLANMDDLTVNGLLGPLLNFKSLLDIQNYLVEQLKDMDVVVGVDFNVFNLMLEKKLKRIGVPTVHYVSPSVYAWRQGRAYKVEQSADLLLTLFPFEAKFYQDTNLKVEYVGHPLADEIDPEVDRQAVRRIAREELNLPQDSVVVALLPGSRLSEVKFHSELFINTCTRFRRLWPYSTTCQFVVPVTHDGAFTYLQQIATQYPEISIRATRVDSRTVLNACDVALAKSGTTTLETLLLRVPVVVTYKIGWLTYAIVRSVLHTPRVALPNILSGKRMVPEFLQQTATAETLARNLLDQLHQAQLNEHFFAPHTRLHQGLRLGASERAATAVLNLVRDIR